jgi:Aminoglycoside-2''-adenylyltransferase
MPFDPSVESIAALFTPLPIIWGFCGGWAIDLFLNRTTRPHKDVDIAILRGDQRVVFDFLRQKGWTLEQAVDGKLLPFHRDEFLLLPVHTIWCRNTLARPDFLEVLLNESERDQFLFRRDPSIRYPLNEAFTPSPSGFPILAPEIALLYKAGHPQHAENPLDFQSLLPALNARQRQWLTETLNKLYPEHEWLKVLR